MRGQWEKYMKQAPLRFYFVAAVLGWSHEALLCARELVATTQSIASVQELYISQMEDVTNHMYLDLLCYIDTCSETASGSLPWIGDLPKISCQSLSCKERYPEGLDIGDSPPRWLATSLNRIQSALRQTPRGTTISLHATEVLVAVSTDKGNCSTSTTGRGGQVSTRGSGGRGASSSHRPQSSVDVHVAASEHDCSVTLSQKISWANAFLAKYAATVDSAVSKVRNNSHSAVSDCRQVHTFRWRWI